MPLYKNKFRTESMRLSNWDYHWQSSYFITICTKYRIPHFGEIRNGIMGMNEIGIIAYQEWVKSFEIRTDMNLVIDEFVVMPDHFHAIDICDNPFNNRTNPNRHDGRDALQCVSTTINASFRKGPLQCLPTTKNEFGPQRKNLSSIIRGFKGSVTRRARVINPNFGWQTRYHEYVIKEPAVYQKIEKYIINNPGNWKKRG